MWIRRRCLVSGIRPRAMGVSGIIISCKHGTQRLTTAVIIFSVHFVLLGGCTMGIFSWIIFGLLSGVVAKLLLPGRDPGGLIITSLIGIAGSMLGGFIGLKLGFGDVKGFDLRSFGLAVLGSFLLLLGYRLL
jgi:uncharacterized membrane protein YeaQ/YmgE (transglycosylase-associated protein family)